MANIKYILVLFMLPFSGCGIFDETIVKKHIETEHYTIRWTKYCEIEYCHDDIVTISDGHSKIEVLECNDVVDVNITDEKLITIKIERFDYNRNEVCILKNNKPFGIPVKIEYVDGESPKTNDTCHIEEFDLMGRMESVFGKDNDTISFNMSFLYPYDSVFIYPPYTNVSVLEKKTGCPFDDKINMRIADDSKYLVFFKYTHGYAYSVMDRYYDLLPLKGGYCACNIKRFIGIKKECRYIFKFDKKGIAAQ